MHVLYLAQLGKARAWDYLVTCPVLPLLEYGGASLKWLVAGIGFYSSWFPPPPPFFKMELILSFKLYYLNQNGGYSWIWFCFNVLVIQLGEELRFTVGGQHIPFGASPQVTLDLMWKSSSIAPNKLYFIVLSMLSLSYSW